MVKMQSAAQTKLALGHDQPYSGKSVVEFWKYQHTTMVVNSAITIPNERVCVCIINMDPFITKNAILG